MKAAKDTDVYGFHIEYERHVSPDRQPNLAKFSQSDIQCLDQILAAYGKYPVWQLRELSHDEAWQKAWANAGAAHSVKIPMEDVISTLDEEDEILEFLQETLKREQDR
jgi:uncharacterized phage-associated protein